jgi:predicted amidophosphoribosyltransferase
LKYEGYRAIAPEIADIIARRIPQPPRGILTPIPLGRRRLASRGYNQAAEIARALAARWNLPLSESLLRRTRDTKTQTSLAPEEREVNVTGAFQASPRAAVNEGAAGVVRAVILVDDVLTTGATIAAAARSLEAAGWEEIGAVTFARALPFAGRAGS